jgi:hypothetical protein
MAFLFICLWDPNKRKSIFKNSTKIIYKKLIKKISRKKINLTKFTLNSKIIKLNVKLKKKNQIF